MEAAGNVEEFGKWDGCVHECFLVEIWINWPLPSQAKPRDSVIHQIKYQDYCAIGRAMLSVSI